jgi:RNA polymerase sigma factor (TIGR02999 family)
MPLASPKDVTTLLLEWRNGNRNALDELTPLVYRELRQLAARHLRHERPGHTLQTTALVHEVYLKLIDQRRAGFEDRDHFFAAAAHLIRRILVTHARKRQSLKRGGGLTLLALDEAITPPDGKELEVLAIDAALQSLAQLDPRQARMVELRFFVGLSIKSTAEVLGISTATVSREWDLARAWLRRELKRSAG